MWEIWAVWLFDIQKIDGHPEYSIQIVDIFVFHIKIDFGILQLVVQYTTKILFDIRTSYGIA